MPSADHDDGPRQDGLEGLTALAESAESASRGAELSLTACQRCRSQKVHTSYLQFVLNGFALDTVDVLFVASLQPGALRMPSLQPLERNVHLSIAARPEAPRGDQEINSSGEEEIERA